MNDNMVLRRDCPFCEQPQWWRDDPRWAMYAGSSYGAWVHDETTRISCDQWESALSYSTQMWKELEFDIS